MDNQNLDEAIQRLEILKKAYDEQPTSFGCYCFGPGANEDAAYILANKKGVLDLSLLLLKSLEEKPQSNQNYVEVSTVDLCKDGDIPIDYIRIFPEKVTLSDNEDQYVSEKWTEKLLVWGWLSIGIFIIICCIWGFIAIVKMIFNTFC